MIKLNRTKHALLMSVLSLILCISMLVGSTYAWFTYSFTSSGNIIKSGTLNVSMEWADGTKDVPANDSAQWTDASAGAIFKSDNWEPGFTEVYHIKIENEGTLALKYQLNFIVNGGVSVLSDVIDVYYTDPAAKIENSEQLVDSIKKGTLTEFLKEISTTISGNLNSGESRTITLALKMRESAGNEYQGLKIGDDFYLRLLATQVTAEEDSFDNQYDKESPYPFILVSTPEELKAALLREEEVIQIQLQNGIDLGEMEAMTLDNNQNYVIDLNGKTLKGQSRAFNLYSGTMTIKNGKIDRTNLESDSGRFITVGIHNAAEHANGYPDADKATLNVVDVEVVCEVVIITDLDDVSGNVFHVTCNAELNLYNSSFKTTVKDSVYANHIDVYNSAIDGIVNVYEGTTFYGNPKYQAIKNNQGNGDWGGMANYKQHVFIAEGYELRAAEIVGDDKYAWYTVVAK